MCKTLLFLFLLPVSLLAQSVIKGKVVSLTDKTAIPLATVFLSNSSIVDDTHEDGSFQLNNVKNGHYDLVVSCIGYETYHQNVVVYNENLQLADVVLKPNIDALSEVKIVGEKPEGDPNRIFYLRKFTQAFFGKTKNAADCKIINPEVLTFNYDDNTNALSASSNSFLILENGALGYRIKYMLVSFMLDPAQHIIYYTGPYVFEEMNGTPTEKKRWKQRRIEAYVGSEMHFFRSCIEDNLVEEGFSVRKLVRSDYDEKLDPRHLTRPEFMSVTDVKGIYAFSHPNCLVISQGHPNSFSALEISIITFKETCSYFDSNGVIINPLSNIIEDYWANRRVAELLPVDYQVPKK